MPKRSHQEMTAAEGAYWAERMAPYANKLAEELVQMTKTIYAVDYLVAEWWPYRSFPTKSKPVPFKYLAMHVLTYPEVAACIAEGPPQEAIDDARFVAATRALTVGVLGDVSLVKKWNPVHTSGLPSCMRAAIMEHHRTQDLRGAPVVYRDC